MSGERRYPGLNSFTTEQRSQFFGRDREIKELFDLISVEKSVVLFSRSGMGKTSLLNAGVIPLLNAQGMTPVPVRLGDEQVRPETHFSTAFDAAWKKFTGITTAAIDSSARESFWEQVQRCPFVTADGRTVTPVIIFDQFEELFTLYTEPTQRSRFVADLAALIMERLTPEQRRRLRAQLRSGDLSEQQAAQLEKAPPIKFVFSIRSDMLHYMDELSDAIPYILRSRYQLFGLQPTQAREAVVRPAALADDRFACPPFAYSDTALTEILDTLSKDNVVESFELQAVCQALEERLIDDTGKNASSLNTFARNDQGPPKLAPDYYGGRPGLKRIREELYQKKLSELPERQREAAAALIEDALINENGRRRSLDVADLLRRPSVDQPLLDALTEKRLLRREPRLGSFYYEISHDTLLEPINTFRKKREERKREAELAEERRKRAQAARIAGIGITLAALAVAVWFYLQTQHTLEALEAANDARNRTMAEQLRQEAYTLAKTREFDMALARIDSALVLLPGDADLTRLRTGYQDSLRAMR
jgi:hypothetical protein